MLKGFHKISSNFGAGALRSLGSAQYAGMLAKLVPTTPKIFGTKKLVALDERMSQRVTVQILGTSLVIDCKTIDQMAPEGSFTFGLVREIFFRNCYLRYANIRKPQSIENAVDLGGNRGIFTLVASVMAKRVLYVEAQSSYRPVVKRLMADNHRTNYEVENVFVGGSADFKSEDYSWVDFETLLDKHRMSTVDFLKVDIEGSEFELFRTLKCLDRVRFIAMEVHRQHGDPGELVDIFNRHKFQVITCDTLFNETSTMDKVDFLYARHP